MKSLLGRILHGWKMILLPYQRRRKIINNLAGQQYNLKIHLQKQRKVASLSASNSSELLYASGTHLWKDD